MPKGEYERTPLTLPNQANILVSGEKMSRIGASLTLHGNGRVRSRWRVAELSISTLAAFQPLIAMSLLHGDHTTDVIPKGNDVAAMFRSHDIDTPRTTRVKGWAYDPYSFRMIDVSGASTIAE